jgi:hypothetical protein
MMQVRAAGEVKEKMALARVTVNSLMIQEQWMRHPWVEGESWREPSSDFISIN